MSNTEYLKQQAIKMVGLFGPIIDEPVQVENLLDKHSIKKPYAKTEEGFKARLLCADWWFKVLQRKYDRKKEHCQIEIGHVKKGKEIYCSDISVDNVTQKAKRSLKIMENKVAVSDSGDEVNMLDILSSSIANPTNRLAELMVRMAGFEEYAKAHNHVGEFYTLTTPSAHHRYSKGKFNEKYAFTPKDSQNYLVKLWSQIRAAFDRDDIKVYGFRVAEPHHDGTPHWHMLFFMRPEYQSRVREIMHHYATREDSTELSHADCEFCDHSHHVKDLAPCKARFHYIEIDLEHGSATGYLAKYIAKNLGFGIGQDSEDETKCTSEVYDRVKSWASTWGIRQFQQIGGSPVTVWRELRKLKEDHLIEDEFIEQARKAADESNWSLFLTIMGGADAKRIEHTISLLKKNKVHLETGEIRVNKYNEIAEFIIGVCTIANTCITRFKEWQIKNKNSAECENVPHPSAAVGRGVGRSSPWSPVNNCTLHPLLT